MQLQDAPIQDPVIEFGTQQIKDDAFGKPRLSWILWFQGLLKGDTGNSWTPVATNLTAVGTPTITGNYYKNLGFTDFWIKIVPATNTSSTAGTTYFDLPFDPLIDVPCFAVQNGFASVSGGIVDSVTNRCYPPSWSLITGTITISGRVLTA